jgi:DNA polymerase III subunit delta'
MRFSDIPGQQQIKDRLRRTVHEQRVSHAQLFMGPQGSGKLPVALAYAQYINCRNRSAEDSCGTCPSCLQYSKLAHPDLHFLYPVATTKEVDSKPMSAMFLSHWRKLVPESKGFLNLTDWYEQIGIENKQGLINTEDCNDLIRKLSYTSYESEYKVMIIWMVEKIHHTGANKILKILEEPPDKTLFILITEQHELILPTILSRTQLIKFPRYTDNDIEEGLAKLAGCSDDEARNARLMADGNMTEALHIIAEGSSHDELFITFRDWMRICYRRDVQGAVKMAAELNSQGREYMKKFLLYALRVTRFCTLNNFGLTDYINTEGDEKKFVNDFTRFINPSNVHLFASEFSDAIYHIERNANGSILFLDISLKAMKWLKTTG